MTRKEVVQLLGDVERTFPVWDWRYGDMEIWPMVKKEIFFIFFKISDESISPSKTTQATISYKLWSICSSLVYFLAIAFRKPRKVSNLYCGSAAHRVDFEKEFVNRYFFPITTGSNPFNYIQYEYGAPEKNKIYPNRTSVIFASKLYPIFRLGRVFKNTPKLELSRWNEFQSFVKERSGLNLDLYPGKLLRKLESLMVYVDVSSLILRKYRPEQILGLCYYNNSMFAMNYIASKFNIPSFDVQHGGQGSLHTMYTFNNFPQLGSNLLPTNFWCWDQVSANHINSWVGRENSHRVEVKGNPWIEFQLDRYSYKETSSAQKIILYTLQEKGLEDYILEAISRTPATFTWWIRLHPRMLDAKPSIERQLELIECKSKVEIDKAAHYPLPILLRNSFVHISKFSGSIIEAVIVGTPNIIIDQVGAEIYKDYIKNGNAYSVLTKSAEDLLNSIQVLENKD